MDIADLGRMGFLPLRDHDPGQQRGTANVLYGVEMEAPDDENKHRPKRGTAGDVVGAVFAKPEEGQRDDVGAWAFAMPVVGQAPIPTAGTISNAFVANVKPIKDLTPSGRPQGYSAFKDLGVLGTTGAMQALPLNYPGLVVSALEETKQVPIVFPNGPLVSVNRGEPACGSLIADLKDDSSLDPERRARLQSLARVAKIPPTVLPSGPDGGVLALQYGVTGKDAISGFGLIAAAPFSGNGNDLGSAGFTRPDLQTVARGGTGVAQILGPMSAARGGPITLGDQSCQHLIGMSSDGERVQPAHIATDAVFWQSANREGKIAFDTAPYTNPARGPRRIPGYLLLDPNGRYNLPTGPNGAARGHTGVWRIEADSWVEEQYDGPPPTGDAFPPPPVGDTVVRFPPGGGGGGPKAGPVDPGTGEAHYNPDGSVNGGRPNPRTGAGQPPPVAGGGVRGPGGNPEPDESGWKNSPWGPNPSDQPWWVGPPPPEVTGPTDIRNGGFGGPADGSQIPNNGPVPPNAIAVGNAAIGAFRPYDLTAIPPTLSNPYPGVKKASFPAPVSTSSVAVMAFPTNPLAPDTRRGSQATTDIYTEGRRPQTMTIAGYGAGNGFDGGWVYTNPPGTTTPTAKGGLVYLPGSLTLQQYRTGVYPTQPETTVVAVKDLVGTGWGIPLANGGVQGVRAVADAAGLSFRPTDSTGAVVSGVGLRIGEGGVIVTGKLTVTGRLDPTTIEFTDTTTDNIPNGTPGFRFDSATNVRPLWKQKGSPYTTTALALYSDLASAGLPTRYISGLVIRYASSSTITVSAGKARDKADAADMELASQVTVSTGTANAALGYERKALTGTHTINFGTAAITGSGSAYLTEFGGRALTGTFSNTAATVTGTGTKFLTEVAVNDLIGVANTTNCLWRVSAIASDTSLTLETYPSAQGKTDFSGATGVVVEQPILETAAGKAVGLVYITSNTAAVMRFTSGSATETGVAAYASSKALLDSSSYTCLWRAVWLLSGGSGTTVAFSTQRTTPYLSITGYTTSYRRIGWVRVDSAGDLVKSDYIDSGGAGRRAGFLRVSTNMVVNAASGTTPVSGDCSTLAPPTAYMLYGALITVSPNTPQVVAVQARGTGTAPFAGTSEAGGQRIETQGSASSSTSAYTNGTVKCDGAQFIEHYAAGGSTGDGTYFQLYGWEELLE